MGAGISFKSVSKGAAPGTVVSANNGLQENPQGNVQLGGPLVEAVTTITLLEGLILAFFNSTSTDAFTISQAGGRLFLLEQYNDGAGNDLNIFRNATTYNVLFTDPSGTCYYKLLTGGTVDIAGIQIKLQGRVAVGNFTATAYLHLVAGGNVAGNAPFKYTAGTNLTAPENGAKEFDGTNEFITAGAVRYTLAKTLTATAALDFPNTLAQTSSNLTIAVTGAALGDVVALGVPNGAVNANSDYSAFVSAANTVTVRFNNYSAAAIDPASGTFRVSVLKY